ncbi:hypothetical protein BDN70DRAFT_853990 [Pholiota conissans]|uniref:Heterokaryon incompatibility domain-containing protein n=1 Tax=Pholiota conissans TaxID=109636 RepID=A0A9P6D331_9AGAR|nr:hypothetical protein BDN70DRAFT_853990 [Pholiota conissans]
MAPNKKDSFTGSTPSVRSDRNVKSSATNHSSEDQVLLGALRDFIVPFVKGTIDKQRVNELDKALTGRAAEKLTSALRDFISSLVKASSPVDNSATIDIDLGRNYQRIRSDASESDDTSDESDGPEDSYVNTTSDSDQDDPFEPGFKENLLPALHGHVFNKMPIRLLHIEPRGSHLQVSLIDREAIYTLVEPRMQAKIAKIKSRGFQRRTKSNGKKESDDEIINRMVLKCTEYAILSHTWLRPSSEEVTFDDWVKRRFSSKERGYQKLVNFCKEAFIKYDLAFGWMDTLCINKDSSSELDESIRSMFNWYERSEVCIIYLADTGKLADMDKDRWFTRGWTLQELLAPDVVKFYTRNWKRLAEDSYDDKVNKNITKYIERATKISEDELGYNIRSESISRRMEMAATRQVTRDEDAAYSLMGIFDVSISIAYGEGAERAFFRLLQKILKANSKGTLDVFNWAGGHQYHDNSRSFLLPSSPRKYINRSTSVNLEKIAPLEPLTLTHMGLRIPLLLLPGVSRQSSKTTGSYSATVKISSINRSIPKTYYLLDDKMSGGDGAKQGWSQYTFAVFNIEQGTRGIHIPQTCIAIVLKCSQDAGQVTSAGSFKRIGTRKPTTFEMRYSGSYKAGKDWREVQIDCLKAHGMQLVSLYL